VALGNESDEKILYGDCVVENNGSEEKWVYADENRLSFRFLCNYSLAHPSMFIKRELFKTLGLYNENHVFSSDWEFYLLAIIKHDVSIRKIDIPISKFDLSGISSDPQNKQKMMSEREEFLLEHFRYFQRDYQDLERLDNSFPIKIYRVIKSLILFPHRIIVRINKD
ncbi:hypothetical protein LCGC14_2698840, partial [marine sediment metagenome]